MKKILLFLSFFVFSIGHSTTVIDSVSTYKNKRLYSLEAIRVVAETPKDAIGSIDMKLISAENGQKNITVAETIQTMPGIALTTGGKGESSLRIRGFDKREVKILVDGQPINGGYFGNVDLNLLPLSDIKAIHVVKGPISALYGTNTMGGVVNILTRSPNNDSWLTIGSQFKRNNTNRIYISSSRDLGAWHYWLYGSRIHTDGMVLSKTFSPTFAENGSIRNNSQKNQFDFQTKIGTMLGGLHSLAVQAGYTYMDTKEIPGSIYEPEYRRFTDWKRYQLSSIANIVVHENLTTDFSVYYDAYDNTYETYRDPQYTITDLHSVLESWNFGFAQKTHWQPSATTRILAGYRGEKQVVNRKDNGAYKQWTSHYQYLHHGFVHTEWKQFSPITISAGSGFSFFKQEGRDTWEQYWEPSIGIYYDLSENISSAIAFSHNVKYPTMRQLFSASKGNPALKPEQANKLEYTLSHSIRTAQNPLLFSYALFYNEVTDLIDYTNTSGHYDNIHNVNSYGIELGFDTKIITEHHIDYAYMNYMKESDYALLEVPKHTVNIEESITLPGNIICNYAARWQDRRISMDSDDNRHTLPAFWLHNIQISKKLNRYTIMAGISNIADTNYEEEYGFPGPGINFIIHIEAALL